MVVRWEGRRETATVKCDRMAASSSVVSLKRRYRGGGCAGEEV
jgi:hypothetical protein